MSLLNVTCLIVLSCVVATVTLAGDDADLFREDFEQAELGSIPKELLVLSGGFAVKTDERGKFLELPGSPVEGFGLLFGPTETQGVTVSARIWATPRGRLNPAFGVGLNGVSGYRLQVAPGKRVLEICIGEAPKTEVPFVWKGGEWTCLRLQVRKSGKGTWIVEGKAWAQSEREPERWMIILELTEEPPAGRASVWGSPYAGTPIRFDDLMVRKIANGK